MNHRFRSRATLRPRWVACAVGISLIAALAVTRARWEAGLLALLPDNVVREAASRVADDCAVQLEAGRRARRAGRVQDAVAALGLAAVLLPESPDAGAEYALALADAGDYDAGLQQYQRARPLAPQHPGVRVFYARWLLATADPRTSLVSVSPLLQQSPGCAEGWHVRALAHLDLHNTRESLYAIRRAIRLSPNWAQFHRDAAQAYRRDGDLVNAEASSRRALQLSPGNPGSALILAQVLLDRGPTPAELKEAEGLLKLSMNESWTRQPSLREMGRTESLQGRWKDAERTLREACRIEPRDPNAWYHLAQVLRRTSPHQFRAALTTFGRLESDERTERFLRGAVKEEVDRFEPRMRLAEFYLKSGRRTEALQVLRDYVRRAPADARAGRAIRRLERPDDAPELL